MTRLVVALMTITASAVACSDTPNGPGSPVQPSSLTMPAPAATPSLATVASTGNSNGIGGAMPAYYDGQLFTINFKELPPGGEDANLANNGSINTIYQSDGCMPGGKMFVSVLDAIQGDGFNPLWREVQVVFKKPASCRQLTSDTEILAAASSGLVTLAPTSELYRCSVIGRP